MDNALTLLAHLVPRLTAQVEDAATDALGFILNRSAPCRGALDRLLQDGDFAPEPIARVGTQVTYEDGSRPDMIGYDESGATRLVVESKFWAGLQPSQARGYIEQIDAPGPGVLLFIAPASRIETLWAEICRQMENGGGATPEGDRRTRRFEELPGMPDQTRTAQIVESGVRPSDKRLMLISWSRLLDAMDTASVGDPQTASDLRQLRGLAVQQDESAFQPIHADEFGLALPRRIRGLNKLIDDVVSICRTRGCISTEGLKATPQYDGYGRYLSFPGVDGYAFLCVNFSLWASSGDTPIWLLISERIQINRERLHDKHPLATDIRGLTFLSSRHDYSAGVPIHLKTRVEYDEVLDDFAKQISEVAEVARNP